MSAKDMPSTSARMFCGPTPAIRDGGTSDRLLYFPSAIGRTATSSWDCCCGVKLLCSRSQLEWKVSAVEPSIRSGVETEVCAHAMRIIETTHEKRAKYLLFAILNCLTMRLSYAGRRCRQTKLIYPKHRSPPWLTEDAPRDRSNRLSADGPRAPIAWAPRAMSVRQYKQNVPKDHVHN